MQTYETHNSPPLLLALRMRASAGGRRALVKRSGGCGGFAGGLRRGAFFPRGEQRSRLGRARHCHRAGGGCEQATAASRAAGAGRPAGAVGAPAALPALAAGAGLRGKKHLDRRCIGQQHQQHQAQPCELPQEPSLHGRKREPQLGNPYCAESSSNRCWLARACSAFPSFSANCARKRKMRGNEIASSALGPAAGGTGFACSKGAAAW